MCSLPSDFNDTRSVRCWPGSYHVRNMSSICSKCKACALFSKSTTKCCTGRDLAPGCKKANQPSHEGPAQSTDWKQHAQPGCTKRHKCLSSRQTQRNLSLPYKQPTFYYSVPGVVKCMTESRCQHFVLLCVSIQYCKVKERLPCKPTVTVLDKLVLGTQALSGSRKPFVKNMFED